MTDQKIDEEMREALTMPEPVIPKKMTEFEEKWKRITEENGPTDG